MVHLVCVDCHGSIADDQPTPHCQGCGRSFERRDGIAFFLPTRTLDTDELAVQELYDTVAHTYDGVFQPHIAEHYLEKRTSVVTSLVPRHSTILDVGCGSGRLGERIVTEGYRVFGVDVSPGILGVAARRGLAGVYGALTTNLPFTHGSFDLVMTIATLHHLKTPTRVAATICEMGRVVRPGGFVVLWDHNPRNPYWPILMRRCPQDRGDERLVPLEEIASAVAMARLQPYRVFRSGFIPDFMPRLLLPLARFVE